MPEVWLDSASVSRAHARIVVGPERVVLDDCGSKNGTRVGDRPVTTATTLQDGDGLRFGSVSAVYRSSDSGMSTETHAGSGLRAARPAYLIGTDRVDTADCGAGTVCDCGVSSW